MPTSLEELKLSVSWVILGGVLLFCVFECKMNFRLSGQW